MSKMNVCSMNDNPKLPKSSSASSSRQNYLKNFGTHRIYQLIKFCFRNVLYEPSAYVNLTIWLNGKMLCWWEPPMRSNVSINLQNKKCGSRSISKLLQTKQDSAIKIQFIKAAIADNKSKWETKIQYDCVEIIIIIKKAKKERKEKRKTNKN